jgi:hypothetical protein
MAALEITGMATEVVGKLLADEPNREPWEIGEALAECLLEDEHKIQWPWNIARDKRTPRASLPGADLAGLVQYGGRALFAMGEVKTSWDLRTPPHVMVTKSTGLIHQLEVLANDKQVQFCLIKWLYARCKNTPLWPLYQSAWAHYVESDGQALALFGLLMRDTTPHELDLKKRAASLATKIRGPMTVDLVAWYFPRDIRDWPKLVNK